MRVVTVVLSALAVTGAGCSSPEPVAPSRYAEPDRLFSVLGSNVDASPTLETIVEIDHSRLGAEAGSTMPPARVLIFSNPELEAGLMQLNPLAGIDLPLRVLAYESVPAGRGAVAYQSFDHLRSCHELGTVPELESAYEESLAVAVEGIDDAVLNRLVSDPGQPRGIVTLESPFDFDTTVERVSAGVDAQSDTVWFDRVDFQSRAARLGVAIDPAVLLLFGGPAPGAKAMAEAPTLGLDAFCQKLLVWQDDSGAVLVSFNDLVSQAERLGVGKSPALRIINRRLRSTFETALDPDGNR